MGGNRFILATIKLVILSLFLSTFSQAQEHSPSSGKGFGRGFFMFGGHSVNLENLNSALQNHGYSTFSDNFISLGGGGYGASNNLIIGGEGHGLRGEENTSEGYQSSVEMGYGFFDIGYLFHSKDGLNIYPLLGIGGGGISLKIVEQEIPSFDEVLEDPDRSSKLSTGGFLLSPAIGLDYLFDMSKNEKDSGGWAVGLQLGYTLAPIKGNWEVDGIDVSGGPQLGITGPYLRILIGGGGSGKQMD